MFLTALLIWFLLSSAWFVYIWSQLRPIHSIIGPLLHLRYHYTTDERRGLIRLFLMGTPHTIEEIGMHNPLDRGWVPLRVPFPVYTRHTVWFYSFKWVLLFPLLLFHPSLRDNK